MVFTSGNMVSAGAIHGDGTQLARLDVRQCGNEVGIHHRHLAADGVGDGRHAALVGHMLHVEAGHLLEHLHAQVAKAAGPRAGVVERGFLCLGMGDEGLEVHHVGQHAGIDHHHDRQVIHRGHGREVLHRVVASFLVQVRREHGGRGQHHERVAIGRALHDLGGRDRARSACTVVHHHGLLQAFAQLLAHDARSRVGGAARRKGDNELDHLVGPGSLLREGATEQQRRCGQGKNGAAGGLCQ
jgi:hypothetical protein